MDEFYYNEINTWEVLSGISISSDFECVYRKKIENRRIFQSCESILPISLQEAYHHIENYIEGVKYDDYIDKVEVLKDGTYKIYPIHEDVTNNGAIICTREVVYEKNKCWSKNVNTVNGLFHSLTVIVEKKSEKSVKITAVIIHLMTLYSNFNIKFYSCISWSIHCCIMAFEKASRYEQRKQSMKSIEDEFEKALQISTNSYPFIIHQNKVVRILLSGDKKKMVIQSEMRSSKRVETLLNEYTKNKNLFISQELIKQQEFKSYYHVESFDSQFDIVRIERFNSEEGVALLRSEYCPECTKQHNSFRLLPSGNKLFRENNETIIQSVYHIDLSHFSLKEEINYYSTSHKALFVILYGHALYLLLHLNVFPFKLLQGIASNNNSVTVISKTLELVKNFHHCQLEESPFNLLKLDVKIQLKICSFLQPKHLFSLMQTNNHFRTLLKSSQAEEIWKRVYNKYQDVHSFDKTIIKEKFYKPNWFELSKRSFQREVNWFKFDVCKYQCNVKCKPHSVIIKGDNVIVGGENGIIRVLNKQNKYNIDWSFIGSAPLCGINSVEQGIFVLFKNGIINNITKEKVTRDKIGYYERTSFYKNKVIGWGDLVECFSITEPYNKTVVKISPNDTNQVKLISDDIICVARKDEMVGYDIRCAQFPAFQLEGHLGNVTDFDHFDENYIISGSKDCSIRLWDIRNTSKVIDRPAHFFPVKAVNCYNRKVISICEHGYITITECDNSHLKNCNFVSLVSGFCCSSFNDTKLVCGTTNNSVVIFENK
ncbi:F-box/WD domain containing protein [Entamoeba histolytica HM-1:IMSS-B]|uniref:F-box domain-containing protein n=6 Tax=Entamoeba histolytica TaxID=5759 RepID=C4LYL9_ENTH1|nr:hypothetical protein EHI_118690 [Entamoeba histolytica HM-1:IMSS]EMD48274.1 F-box domain containing protein [Entamoeba histolytica KU27]EMH72451.1 F-box/WD domain containing protein [Entamoeba histolytica HM-1:IMSS-B]EMS15009.1 F-box domain containing protein [Entamoeba histolytica HM-3:IMSS]ENY60681.1 F-box domain containing protein [Entamoeba histolytica HM-1:IMSS-A]GAT93923.1 F-box WD domain containing protein [Entamoeba histolytica]|eukprot:XP_654126.1 hypothetical protein EHI_118690 [Entamoeba histolytica HM-1:IMSS]